MIQERLHANRIREILKKRDPPDFFMKNRLKMAVSG